MTIHVGNHAHKRADMQVTNNNNMVVDIALN